MNELPNFWRTEVWHPLSVHLPIALLLMASLFKIFGLRGRPAYLQPAGTSLLLIGALGAWVAVYTGNLADGVVTRQICDPTVVKAHQNASLTMAWLFTAATVADVTVMAGFVDKYKSLFKALVVVLMLVGSGFLLYTGHLGATLVYQQGAGVHQPAEDCREFE